MRGLVSPGLALCLALLAGCSAVPAPPVARAPEPPAVSDQEKQDRHEKAPKPRKKVPMLASGRYRVVGGHAPPRPGAGPVVRYLVEVERGLPFRGREFAAEVHRILNDPRGWGRFRRVDHGPVRLSVALSSPQLTDRQCSPLRTGGELSCWNGTRSVINALRWARGVRQYRGDLAAYREYVISHEVGHGLGHSHRYCPGRDRLAPVMAQQSKSLAGCRPNPWPHPGNTREPSGS
ncbi:DUF3152 domain-containing protein [Thermoactinospora rubra]|uniref:DUF3152 domain-containing protein n=1 Tax=Thermoactinospora rubra TaxID=1088767 RepID=UPI001F0AC2B3|nr:DUF3152 domain-containing protein [Thermoactinospora rubra]